MRVSTAQIFDSGTMGIQNNQSSLFKTQNQLSTGRRILTPADDPVGATQALVVTQSKQINAQYLENQDEARSHLNLLESNLSGVTDELQNILERAVQAGGGTLGASDRSMIATELQARLLNLQSLANAQDGTGQYLYSGFQTQVKPFDLTGNPGVGAPPTFSLGGQQYISYSGDEGRRKLAVDASVDVDINLTGSEVFMRVKDSSGNLTGRSLFDSVQNLISNLQSANFSRTSYDQSLSDLQSSMDNISRARATVGTNLNALDGLTNTGNDLKLQYEQRLSELQDLDYAKAISDLSRQQMQLEAAQKSFAQISQLSLFNVI